MIKKIIKSLIYFLFRKSGYPKKINNKWYFFSPEIAFGIPGKIDIPMLKDFLNYSAGCKIVFDVGAHIGTWSTLATKVLDSGGKIYSFEPSPFNYSQLLKQAKIKNLPGKIVPVNKAVSNSNGKINLNSISSNSFDQSAKNNISLNKTIGKNIIEVDSVTLDQFCYENKIIPEVIKVDVEGAEKLVLEGAIKLLSENNIILIIELHQFVWDVFNISEDFFSNYVNKVGYELILPEGIIAGNINFNNNNELGYIILKKKFR